ncbi:MAG: response regulator transcription factor [Actinomycetota bacterium]|nr:response regulator transcription factor [Actinomycetota bacterium]
MSSGRPSLRVAVIDNDSGFVQVLGNRMDSAGWKYRILGASVPPEELVSMKLNAVLLNPSVIEEGGWEYLQRICGLLPELGVIVCAEGGTVSQRVRGLRIGADDWINKPSHPEEVMARIEAVARRRRRHSAATESGPLVIGEVEIRSDQFQAFVSGQSLDLTRREFELLQLLGQSEGKVLDRETIYQRVWGYSMAHGDRSVDVFIRKLRHKLEKRSPNFNYIHTHFGVGYRFAAEPPDSAADTAAASDAGRVTQASAEALTVPA